jgi:murein DD-endopeptidase MepM/ murein hydrolase activator NlpD
LVRARRQTSAGRAFHFRALLHGCVAAALFALIMLGGLFPVTIPTFQSLPVLNASVLPLPGLAASAPMTAVTSLEAAPVPLTVVAPAVTAEALLAAADSTAATLSLLKQAQSNASVAVEITTSRDPERVPLYYRHEVQQGDTLSSISDRFGVGARYLEWNNTDVIDDADVLSVGEILRVPSVPGIVHGVRDGETLTEIALQYDADVDDIIAFRANDLSDPNRLRVGESILVVGGKRVPPPAPTLRPTPTFVNREASRFGFVWPVVGEITSWMGPYHPLGIDINARYEPIVSSAAGKVVFAGGDPLVSYGYYVEVNHGDGYVTLYAHFSSIYVEIGEWVERSQVIGLSGDTGRSTGPHLHFELKRYGVIQNPLQFLP